MRIGVKFLRGVLLGAIALPTAPMAASAKTVILVRHAEKADVPADDPALSLAGHARSLALARAVRDAHLTAILTTTLRRTRDTAAPTAELTDVEPQAVSIDGNTGAHVKAVADLIGSMPEHAVVLVVGHSNTVPLIAARLGAAASSAIPECAFDRIVFMDLSIAPPSVVTARYGPPSKNCSD